MNYSHKLHINYKICKLKLNLCYRYKTALFFELQHALFLRAV
jgi:hypothetical protein